MFSLLWVVCAFFLLIFSFLSLCAIGFTLFHITIDLDREKIGLLFSCKMVTSFTPVIISVSSCFFLILHSLNYFFSFFFRNITFWFYHLSFIQNCVLSKNKQNKQTKTSDLLHTLFLVHQHHAFYFMFWSPPPPPPHRSS